MTTRGEGGKSCEISYQVVHLSLPVIRSDFSKLKISSNTGGLKITTHADQACNHGILGRLGFFYINLTKSIF
jgi:hypothetical protein